MTSFDYDQRCAAAATAQGLDPVIAVLEAAGLPYDVDQTGGFVMLVRVQIHRPGRYVWISHVGVELADDRYCVIQYDDRGDDVDEGNIIADGVSAEHVADYVHGFVRGEGFADESPLRFTVLAHLNLTIAADSPDDAEAKVRDMIPPQLHDRIALIETIDIIDGDEDPNPYCSNRSESGDACGECDGCLAEIERMRDEIRNLPGAVQ